MNAQNIFEKSASDTKDGGFIFQAQISHNLSFDIKGGYVVLAAATSYPFDKTRINAKLHQVDLFPDLKTESGFATLTYVILSEVNTLARKFELAAEVVKRQLINPSIEVEQETDEESAQSEQPQAAPQEQLPPASARPVQEEKKQKNLIRIFYRDEVERLEKEGRLTRNEIKRLNNLFFNNTSYTVTLSTDKIFLREVSSSSLDSGSPEITLKISTSLVDEAFGAKVPSFESFKLVVSGLMSTTVTGTEVANFEIFDPIEKKNDKIFQTILPSLILKFKSDQVPVETFTNKSSEIAANRGIDYNDLFNFDKLSAEEEEILDIETIDVEEEPEETTASGKEKKKKNIEVQIEDLTNRIAAAESELSQTSDEKKMRAAQYKLDELKKKLEGAKRAYSNLGESIYVKQELALLEKELNNFYEQFDSLFEHKQYSRRNF